MAAITPIAVLAHAGHVDHVRQLGGPNLLPLLLAVLPFVITGALVQRSRATGGSTVVLFSAAAGFLHAVATPEHFAEHFVFGLFFLVVTVGQMAVVVAGLNRPCRALWVATVAGNAIVLAIWAVSRTTGLPFGPEAWTPEPIGLLDMACAGYEIALIAAGLTLAGQRDPMAFTNPFTRRAFQ
jgi:hypothetical protein